MADGTMHEFTTKSIFDSGHLVGTPGIAGGHYGNPDGPFQGQNAGQAYAYVNIFAGTEASKITRVVFFENTFETDNHAVLSALVGEGDHSGEIVDTAPTPSALLLMTLGLGLLGWSRNKAKGQATDHG